MILSTQSQAQGPVKLLFQCVVMAQLRHARAFHHAGDSLDLLGLLGQLRTLLQFLGEVTRV